MYPQQALEDFRIVADITRQKATMTDTQVRQWQSHQDGLDKIVQGTAPMPSPGEGQVLVKIHAVSLNYRDTEVAMGLYNHHKSVDASPAVVLCSDMCGTIESVGNGVSQWSVGDRVLSTFLQDHHTGQVKAPMMGSGLGLPLDGVLQTYRVFSAQSIVKAPKHLSDEEAACLPIAAVTAWMAINQFRPMGQPGGKGEIVLLQGTGGVAISGLQIAHAAGATTIVTSSSDEKLEKAKALGADHVINYRTQPDWHEAALKLTDNEGADIILETGGAQTLRKSFDAIAFGGTISAIGYLSGKEDAEGDRLNTNLLALRKNVTLKGVLNGPRDRFEEMVEFYEKKSIKPVVDRVFGFEEAKDALEYLYGGKHFGKVIIKVA